MIQSRLAFLSFSWRPADESEPCLHVGEEELVKAAGCEVGEPREQQQKEVRTCKKHKEKRLPSSFAFTLDMINGVSDPSSTGETSFMAAGATRMTLWSRYNRTPRTKKN